DPFILLSQRHELGIDTTLFEEYLNANIFVNDQSVDLDFKLTIGQETFTHTATFSYYIVNQVSGGGVRGAELNLHLNSPFAFTSQLGTLNITDASGAITLLGRPMGTSQYSFRLPFARFTPVPEPSTLALTILALAALP